MNTLTTHDQHAQSLGKLFESAKGRWRNCNWQTAFGPRKFNLIGMRSHQTRVLADATSGEESSAWEDATSFLDKVEQDALAAEKAAHRATEFVQLGQLDEAIRSIDEAVRLEAKYRDPVTWKPLCEAIHSLLGDRK